MATGKSISYTHIPGNDNSLLSSWISDLALLPDGRVLVSTNLGVQIWDRPNNRFTKLGFTGSGRQINSSTDTHFGNITRDPSGNYWITNAQGLHKVDIEKEKLIFFRVKKRWRLPIYL